MRTLDLKVLRDALHRGARQATTGGEAQRKAAA